VQAAETAAYLAAHPGKHYAVGGPASAADPSATAVIGSDRYVTSTMVASMSRGKKAYVQHERELSEAIARLGQLREELKASIDADAESYNAVMKAYKQAKESSDGEGLISAALKQATAVPLEVAERAREVATIAEKLGPITNPNMASDLTTGIALAEAAITGALANVEINLQSLKDEAFVGEVRKKVTGLARR